MLLPVGDGGIFQHGVEVARLLDEAGVPVTLHVSDRHEEIDVSDLDVCRCVRWRWRTGWRRKAGVAASYLFVSQPHFMRATKRGEIVHMQGLFYTPLTWVTMCVARLTGRRVVHTPHNTFSRGGQAWDARIGRALTRLASRSVVFSLADVDAVAAQGGEAVWSPLVVPVDLDPVLVDRRRAAWREAGAEQVVLFAGQIRPDKRPDLLVRAAVGWPPGRRAAFVGGDKGAWEPARELAVQLGVDYLADIGYLDLDEFTAALAAADVVVCPYDQASQSAVIAVARAVGTATVASDVGGLGEAADVAVAPDDPAALARGIAEALELAPGKSGEDQNRAAVDAHRTAYAAAESTQGVAAFRAVLRSFG